MVDDLAIRREGSPTRGKQDCLDTLTMLVEAHDREYYELDVGERDPIAMLQCKSYIRKSADHFKAAPGLFLV